MAARINGLDGLGLTVAALARLGNRRVQIHINLNTYDVTAAVRRRPPSQRHAFLEKRVDRWIDALARRYPKISFRAADGKLKDGHPRRWSELPHGLEASAPARSVKSIAMAPGVHSVYVDKVPGHRRRRRASSEMEWYCVRGLVAIRIENQESGLQTTEDRFVLVRASSFKDAERRLRREWREYSEPYLNSEGEMVSWTLDKVVDVYETFERDIDPAGTEVYSKLGQPRIRPEHVWPPRMARRTKKK